MDFASLAEGYCTLPFLDRDAVAQLRSRFEALGADPASPRFLSTLHCDHDVAAELDRTLRTEIGGLVAEVVGDYRPFFSTFIYKGPRDGARIDIHQDWTYTDERTHRVVTGWIPLVDVDASNGAMEVIPGSHRWVDGLRVSNAQDRDEPTQVHQEAFEALAVTLPMAAGDLLLYDPGLLHGSPPNTTDQGRLAFGVTLAPEGAPLVHFRRDEHDVVHGAIVPDGTFYFDAHLGSEFDVPVEPWADPVQEQDFEAPMARYAHAIGRS